MLRVLYLLHTNFRKYTNRCKKLRKNNKQHYTWVLINMIWWVCIATFIWSYPRKMYFYNLYNTHIFSTISISNHVNKNIEMYIFNLKTSDKYNALNNSTNGSRMHNHSTKRVHFARSRIFWIWQHYSSSYNENAAKPQT